MLQVLVAILALLGSQLLRGNEIVSILALEQGMRSCLEAGKSITPPKKTVTGAEAVSEANNILNKQLEDGLSDVITTDAGFPVADDLAKRYPSLREDLRYTAWAAEGVALEDQLFVTARAIRRGIKSGKFYPGEGDAFIIELNKDESETFDKIKTTLTWPTKLQEVCNKFNTYFVDGVARIGMILNLWESNLALTTTAIPSATAKDEKFTIDTLADEIKRVCQYDGVAAKNDQELLLERLKKLQDAWDICKAIQEYSDKIPTAPITGTATEPSLSSMRSQAEGILKAIRALLADPDLDPIERRIIRYLSLDDRARELIFQIDKRLRDLASSAS